MPEKAEHTPYLEEVAVPLEAFQSYLEGKQREKARLKLAIVVILALTLALVAATIALALLTPLAPSLMIFMIVVASCGYYALGGLSMATNVWSNLKHKLNLEEKNIQVTFSDHSQIKLSQVNQNGVEHTLIITDKGPSTSIRDQILDTSSFQQDILSMIAGTIKELEAEQTKLVNKKAKLKNQIKNTAVEYLERLGVLSERLKTVEQQIISNDQKISALKDILPNAKLKETIESKYKKPIESLLNFLEYHKKDLISIKEKRLKIKEKIEQLKKEKIKHRDLDSAFSEKINTLETKLKNKRSELTKELNKIFTEISKIEEEYNDKLKTASDIEQVTINSMLDKMHSRISILSEAFLEVDPEFYLEYFEKDATEHYSRLLADPNTSQETLTLLNQILRDYPLPSDAINQHINHILADYSGAVQFSNKTPTVDALSAFSEIVPSSASPSHRK